MSEVTQLGGGAPQGRGPRRRAVPPRHARDASLPLSHALPFPPAVAQILPGLAMLSIVSKGGVAALGRHGTNCLPAAAAAWRRRSTALALAPPAASPPIPCANQLCAGQPVGPSQPVIRQR